MSLDGFSAAARDAVAAADDEARRAGGRTGTEHLLLGVLAVETCGAAQVLREAGLSTAAVRRKVSETSLGAGGRGEAPPGTARSPRAERALGRAHRFAHDGRAAEVASTHLLLGVLDVEGTAGQVLRGLGADVDALRARLVGFGPSEESAPAAGSTPVDAPSPASVVRCPSCAADLATVGAAVADVPVEDGSAARAYVCAACRALLGIRGISAGGATA